MILKKIKLNHIILYILVQTNTKRIGDTQKKITKANIYDTQECISDKSVPNSTFFPQFVIKYTKNNFL